MGNSQFFTVLPDGTHLYADGGRLQNLTRASSNNLGLSTLVQDGIEFGLELKSHLKLPFL